MGFLDKIKNMVSVPEEDYYDEYDEPVNTEEKVKTNDSLYSNTSSSKNSSYDDLRSTIDVPPAHHVAPEPPRKSASHSSSSSSNKVVNFSGGSNYQMVLVKPETFGEATTIADHLMGKSTVVLNLESISPNAARKLIDFLAGVTYATNGQFKQVAASTYVITPHGVDVRGDVSMDALRDSEEFI